MLGFKVEHFDGFTAADFDAYDQHKWKSNRYNIERMKVNAKLDALGGLLAPILASGELPLEKNLGLDHPSVFNNRTVEAGWVYFSRTDAQKKALGLLLDKNKSLDRLVADPAPHHQHAMLCARIDHAGVDVSIRIHSNAWLDAQNFFEKLAEPWELEKFKYLTASLDEDVALRLSDTHSVSARQFDEEDTRVARAALGQTTEWIRIGRSFDRTEPVVGTADFGQTCCALFSVLAPIFKFILWDRSNDYLRLGKVLEGEKAKKKLGVAKPLSPGEKVVIVAGPFEGRSGVIERIDTKGLARVLVGNVSLRIHLRDLKSAPTRR